jgi:hypothetical protein
MTQPKIHPRPIHVIAREIRNNWPKPNYAALPYLDAMRSLDSIKDPYYADSGESVVRYFLANAMTFRGDKARELKTELKEILKGAR